VLKANSAGWRGITVELHRIPSTEFPEHYIEGHRLMVQVGAPTTFEWKRVINGGRPNCSREISACKVMAKSIPSLAQPFRISGYRP
jgi:hypothetical protein